MRARDLLFVGWITLAGWGCGGRGGLPLGPPADGAAAVRDGGRDAGADGEGAGAATFKELMDLCLATGGTLQTRLCCPEVPAFPSTCGTDVCVCRSQDSTTLLSCACGEGRCFSPERGCTGPVTPCTPGMDYTCNESPAISSILGRCTPDRKCVCASGSTLNPATGKCR
jgi:hypothetical protein